MIVVHFVCVFVFCRYIIHSDANNPYLSSMEEFAQKLIDFKPDLLVVGGLQMMDNFPFRSGKKGVPFFLMHSWAH